MTDSEKKLRLIREKIDAIDEKFLKLLAERADLAHEVAQIKARQSDPVYYRPEREAQVLRSLVSRNQSRLPDLEIERVFRDIMTACLALQKPLEIAYLGPEGTFSQQAAVQHFGEGSFLSPKPSIPEIFRAVSGNQVQYGVVPVENSTEGMIHQTLDELLRSDVQICGEINLRIHQNFVSCEDSAPIRQIYSHQQSLAQCREWLMANHPDTPCIAVASNALAASMAAEDPASAAICGDIATRHYALVTQAAAIEDYPNNTTRFIIIGKQSPSPSGQDKTSLVFSSPHEVGSLGKILKPFEHHHLNMTLIESRPYRHRNWTYLFFIDFEGHQADANVQNALAELISSSEMMTILGSYPQAIG